MKCENCGKYILDNSKECEFCGAPQKNKIVKNETVEPPKENIAGKKWFSLVVGIVVSIVLVVIIVMFVSKCGFRESTEQAGLSYGDKKVTENVETTAEVTTEEPTVEEPTIGPTTEEPTEPPTEDPKVLEENFKKYCEIIDYKTLARNPDKYIGNWYKFTGEVVQVIESSWSDTVELRINVTKEEYENLDYVNWSDTIYATVEIPDGEDRILEDDIITFWGTCKGMCTYETVLGSSVSLPKIDIEYYALGEQ